MLIPDLEEFFENPHYKALESTFVERNITSLRGHFSPKQTNFFYLKLDKLIHLVHANLFVIEMMIVRSPKPLINLESSVLFLAR